VARLKGVLDDIHTAFITHVKDRRGDRLSDATDLFSGEFWLGGKAIELGLADGFGHILPRLKEVYGDKVRLLRYGRRRGLLSRFGLHLAQDAMTAVEDRAQYARFGL
jgi:serine protease SohB